MPMPPESSPSRLFVEGPDDKWSIINLLTRHGYDWDNSALVRPFVRDVGGIREMLKPALVDAACKTYRRLGFVMDADQNVTDRWGGIRRLLQTNGVRLPENPEASGAAVEMQDGRRVGVWLMPDNTNPGILEHFIGKLIPANDACRRHADEATTRARELGAPLRELDHIKGVVHTWLAWQETPGLPFGTALTTRILRHDAPEAVAFVDWFNRLFGS